MSLILLLKTKKLLSHLNHAVALVADNLIIAPFLTIPPVD